MFREVLSVRFDWYLQTHVRSFSNNFESSTETYRHLRTPTSPNKHIAGRSNQVNRFKKGNQHVYQINIAYRRVYPINNKQDTRCFLRKRAGNSLPTDARKSKPLHIMRHDQLSEHNR